MADLPENPITGFIESAGPVSIESGRTAMLIVDMQYHDAHRDYGMGRRAQDRGDADRLAYYWSRLETIIPRQRELLAAARVRRIEVIFSAISAVTKDCREIGPEYRRAGIRVPVGSKEASILDELEVGPDEIVLPKSTASVFNSTTLDRVLRNLKIDTLIVAGVLTRGCVESTVRDAADLGYQILLVEDACGDLTEQRHYEAIAGMRGSFAEITSTGAVLDTLRGVGPAVNAAGGRGRI
ncbi:MAG: cysteine hydrolase family protein [Armatimonadota bacterium]